MKKFSLIKTSCTFLASVVLYGCVSHKTAPSIHHYSLESSTDQTSTQTQEAGKPILRVMPVAIEPQYAGKSFVYRTSDLQYIDDPYQQFLVAPNLQITDVISANLSHSVNALVVGGDSLLLANYALQLKVTALYADYQNKAQPMAVTSIQAELYEIKNGITNLVSSDTFEQTQKILPNNPKDLIKAYDKNLKKISKNLADFVGKNLA